MSGAVLARPEGAPSLLVPSSTSLPTLPPEICGRRPYWVTPIERPELRFPASCDSYGCSCCGPRKAQSTAAVMTWALSRATRRRLVTLTAADENWQDRRWRMNALLRELRRDGRKCEWAWSTEVNPKGTGYHVHAVQWGDFLPIRDVVKHWGAVADARALKQPGAGVYAVKEALRVAGYAVKGAVTAEGLGDHLEVNGGRVAHWSRGFLHGSTRREALSEVRKTLSDGEPLTWRLVPAWLQEGIS